jgi:ATP-dependent Clp protease protease subunit
MIIPYISEQTEHGERRDDIYSRLLKDRIIFLGSEINADVANAIVAQLLFLSSADPKADIKLYINSPGGEIASGLAIISTMNIVPNNIQTIAVGMAASMAAVILSNGTKGKRKVLEYGNVMIHQPRGGAHGTSSDIEIAAKYIVRLRTVLNELLAKNTGKKVEEIEFDCERDYWMDAEESLKYGIVDEILRGS